MSDDNTHFNPNVIEIHPLTRPSTASTTATRVMEPGKEQFVPPVPPIPRDYSTVALEKSQYSPHEGEGAIPDDAQVCSRALFLETSRMMARSTPLHSLAIGSFETLFDSTHMQHPMNFGRLV